MSLAKRAQFWDDNFLKEEDKEEDFGEILVDGFESLLSDLSVEDDGSDESEDDESEEGIFFESDISSEDDKVTGDVLVSVSDLDGFEESEEFSFTLPALA